MITNNAKCEHCAYFERTEVPQNKDAGFCHRNPPVPLVITQHDPMSRQPVQTLQSQYPPTTADNWCGQFMQKLDA